MAKVVKTIKACHIEDGMRIRHDLGAYTIEGDVKSVVNYGPVALLDVTFERDGNEALILIGPDTDVDVLRKPAPKEPKNPGALIKRTGSWGEIAYFVRTKSDYTPGYAWLDVKVGCEYPWLALTDDNDCTIEVLSEGVNIDD